MQPEESQRAHERDQERLVPRIERNVQEHVARPDRRVVRAHGPQRSLLASAGGPRTTSCSRAAPVSQRAAAAALNAGPPRRSSARLAVADAPAMRRDQILRCARTTQASLHNGVQLTLPCSRQMQRPRDLLGGREWRLDRDRCRPCHQIQFTSLTRPVRTVAKFSTSRDVCLPLR
jgi:hypothetical protein